MSTTIAPTTVQFPIQPHERNGTPIIEAYDIEVKVTGPQQVKGEIKYKNTQPFVSFTTTTVGDYSVAMFYKGGEIQASPVVVKVSPKKSDEDTPKVAPLPAPARYPVKFEVDARDKNGDAIPANGALNFRVAGPEPVQLNVQRSGGEKIYISFETIFLTGTFKIEVLYNDEPIQRSPFELNLAERPRDSVSSTTEEIARLPPLPQERTIQFKVPGKLVNGKAVKANECAASVDGPSKAVITKLTDKDDDIIVSFDVSKPGEYKISVTKNGEHIDESPFEVDVPEDAFKKTP